MAYSIIFKRQAIKQMGEIPKKLRDTINEKIVQLAKSPRTNQEVKKLQGEEGLYRLRVGDYRVVYQLIDDELVILVVKVKHRKDVYR